MEVHAHAHTARKKWTHYFWEFLMLFLAVFCGFLAEYLLEHKIEKERAKKYIHSMYEDLKTDTATFAGLTTIYQEKVAHLQTFNICYEAILNNRDAGNCMENIIAYSSAFPDMITADRTLQQLKSSGSIRLLNDEDADSIIAYDAVTRKNLQGERTDLQEVQTQLRTSSYDVLNFRGVYRRYFQPDSTQEIPILQEEKKEQINKLFNVLNRYLLVLYGRLDEVTQLKKKAENLLRYFEKKYHFK